MDALRIRLARRHDVRSVTLWSRPIRPAASAAWASATPASVGLNVAVLDSLDAEIRALAAEATRRAPKRYVEHAAKADRKGRIFVDYLRNGWGASIVTPFSTRSRPGAPVSTPLTWDELRSGAEPLDFTVRTVPARIAGLREDPWHDYAAAARQTITRAALAQLHT